MAEDQDLLKPYIVFAEGTFALFKDIIPDVEIEDPTGVKRLYNIFYIKPLAKLRIKYKITEKDESFQNTGAYMGFYKKMFLKEYCKPLDLSPRSAVWILFCDWNGKFIDIFGGEHTRMFDKLRQMQKETIGLRRYTSALQHEFIKMSRNPLEYALKSAEKIRKILKASTIVVGGEKERETNEGQYGGQ